MAAPLKVRPFFSERRRAAQVMDRNFDAIAEKIGRRVATVFIVLLYALFAYGYLGVGRARCRGGWFGLPLSNRAPAGGPSLAAGAPSARGTLRRLPRYLCTATRTMESVMAETDGDRRAQRIGSVVGTIFLVALGAMFAYGYLEPILIG
jgi:hypothetical protein